MPHYSELLDRVNGKPIGRISPVPGSTREISKWMFERCETCGQWVRAYISIQVKSDGTTTFEEEPEWWHTNKRNDSKCDEPKVTVTV